MQKFYAVDTEDDTKGTTSIIDFFDGEFHFTFTGEQCRYKAWGFLHQISPAVVWACNAEYDLLNIFGADWLGKLCTLQYVKAGFMRGCFRECKVTFFDTYRHWPVSVKRMGELLGFPKLDMPHNMETMGCTCNDCVTYCQRDAEITYKFTAAMLEQYYNLGLYKIKATLPGMAIQFFKQEFYFKEFPRINSYCKRLFRRGYYGGRVEVYQTGLIEGDIQHYDVNSLFPSVMKKFSYPELSSLEVKTDPDLEREGMFEGYLNVPYSKYPCLPIRDEEILFPVGPVFGCWPYPEIRQLLKDGGSIVNVRECVEFEETENPFDRYVDFCYQQRLKSANPIEKEFWKLMLNSLYGKFGSHGEIETIYDDEVVKVGGEAKYSNVVWSAYVTSYARLHLLKFLRSTTECYYTDTDSLFTPDLLPTSTVLGELKREGEYSQAWFKGNKLYTLDGTVKAKGVPKLNQLEFFQTGKTSYLKPTRYRESRKTSKKANHWLAVEKHIINGYTKRRIVNNGSTEPWTMVAYKKFMREGGNQ